MNRKLNNLKWATVALEGVPVETMTQKFDGFVGLEECTDYGFEKENNANKKQKKKPKKRKTKAKKQNDEVTPSKQAKFSNGFLVESCTKTAPSQNNETDNTGKEKVEERLKKQDNKNMKPVKPKLGENVNKFKSLTLEEMQEWSEFQIPAEILKALAEQGFKKPTKIQELTLPTAMLGRRDILGAAQTGSGKTLAFGIPILSGIMKLKEKAQSGEDVYELQYKKTSTKKRSDEPTEKITRKKINNKSKTKKPSKESSEEGYSSGTSDNDKSESDNSDDEKSDDYIEEYEVPVRKNKPTADDETSDSGDENDEDYVHLSETVDSDDFADTSDDESEQGGGSDDEEGDKDMEESEGTDSQNEYDGDDVDATGIGCVKVIDDIEMPSPDVVRTGKPLYALIITPTRELAIQISRHLISAAKYTGIRIATVVGGMASVKQERLLSKSPEVVVGTPGRLWQLMKQGQPHLQQVDSVKFLAIDETDRMVERNHFEELHPLLERINMDEAKKQSRQNFVFSATLTMVHDLPDHMKGKKVTKRGKIINRKTKKMTPQQKIKKLIDLIGMTEPKVVDITTQNLGTAETLTECRIVCSLEEKDYYLFYILKRHPGRAIVFCNSIGSVRRLSQLFGLLKCNPLPLHASMPQRQRLKNLERFRDDPQGVLVSTDVAARGLDIPDIDHVIHYQVPRTAENYVHRSGRTARANKEGLTILMMEPGEAMTYAKLCKTLNKQSELPTFPVPSHTLNSMKSIVKLSREVDRLLLDSKRAASEQGWLDKAARDMDMIVDEDFVPMKAKDSTAAKRLSVKRKQLESLLSKPIFPKGFSFKYPTLNEPITVKTEDNALQVMKKAIESGEVKKEKRTGKNATVLKLQKSLSKSKSK